MISHALEINKIQIPTILGKYSMIPFDLSTLDGLSHEFKRIAMDMIKGIKNKIGTAYFTIHGKSLICGSTLRRGGPHTDGNYEPYDMSFGGGGGGGWKVGENGPSIKSNLHKRQYLSETGGILIASNYQSSVGWIGEFENKIDKGGDCSKIKLNQPFKLKENTVYYGNNHFIHESLPINKDVHRTMVRITLPEDHMYKEK